MTKEKAVFLDRDGTLVEEVDHLSTVEETRLYPYTIEALEMFSSAGYRLVVVTNQSGIARGYFDATAVNAIHAKIQTEIGRAGLLIDSFHFCPHMPDAGCRCRKPSIGMIEQALENRDYDLKKSWMIGDKELDVGVGVNAGTGSVLVRTGYGRDHEKTSRFKPTIIANNLLDAAKKIVNGG